MQILKFHTFYSFTSPRITYHNNNSTLYVHLVIHFKHPPPQSPISLNPIHRLSPINLFPFLAFHLPPPLVRIYTVHFTISADSPHLREDARHTVSIVPFLLDCLLGVPSASLSSSGPPTDMNDVSWDSGTLATKTPELPAVGLPLNPAALVPKIDVDGEEETEIPPSNEWFFFGLFRN